AVAAAGVLVHLAVADGLAVARRQQEVQPAVGGALALVARVDLAVLAHRLDALQRRGLLLVALAAEDHLTVAGLEHAVVLPVALLGDAVFACHIRSPPRSRARRL